MATATEVVERGDIVTISMDVHKLIEEVILFTSACMKPGAYVDLSNDASEFVADLVKASKVEKP